MLGKIYSSNEGVYFIEGNRFRLSFGEEIILIKSIQGLIKFQFGHGGVWLGRDLDEIGKDEPKSIFFDIYQKGLNNKDYDYPIAGCKFFKDDVCVGYDNNETDGKYLFILNFTKNKVKKLIGYFSNYACDGFNIFSRDVDGQLICNNMSFEEQWRVSLKKERFKYWGNEIQLYKNLVILNVGEDPKKRRDADITAFSKVDGNVVWIKNVTREPDSCNIIDDAVYITVDNQMIVLDAETGDVRVDEQMGFSGGRGVELAILFTDGKNLIALSEGTATIKIFTLDGKTLVQEFKVPTPYTPSYKYLPVLHEDKIYVDLTVDFNLVAAMHAMLILSPVKEGEEPIIKTEERPPFTKETIKMGKGKAIKHEYVYTTHHDNLEDILRFTPIIIKEAACLKGSQMYTTDERDKKFNGKFTLIVDPTHLPEDAEKKIREMAEENEKYLNEMGIYSGDGKNTISIKVEMG